MKKTSVLGFIFLVNACASEPEPTEYERVYQLEPSNPLSCIGYREVTNLHSPPDLVAGANKCVEDNNYQGAAELLMIAGSFAFYDAQRVNDHTAHGVWHTLLAKSLGALPQSQKVELFANLDALSRSSEETDRMCSHLAAIDPPAYSPDYMLNQGLNARYASITEALKKDFEATNNWKAAREYVKCRY